MPGRRTTPMNRVEIADAAIGLIGTQGIAALTTTALAKELGVSSGAPFRHFASREEILEAVAERVVEIIGAVFPEDGLPPLERLSWLFLARTSVLSRNPGVARLIFSDQFTKALPEKAAASIRGLIRRTREFLLRVLQEAAERGDIRRDLPPADLLLPVIGTLQHLAFLSALRQDGARFPGSDPEHVLETLLTLLQPQTSAKANP